MKDLCYCQYAFTRPGCRAREIGPGVDPRFRVELIRDESVAALVSRVELSCFSVERRHGPTTEDAPWLGRIAARYNEILCRAATTAPVLPVQLGTLYCSSDSLRVALRRCRATVAEFLERLGNRLEWGIKLYLEKHRPEPVPGHLGPPPPHFSLGDRCVRERTASAERCASAGASSSGASSTIASIRRRVHADRSCIDDELVRTIESVARRLAAQAESSRRISEGPNGSVDRMGVVFHAAYLLPASSQASWFETVQNIYGDVRRQGLALEVSGPWPPYHFCPALE
ncbi:MAG: GvpL/GvpF family gas vesicle protein [Thermoguttaceae bacterium]